MSRPTLLERARKIATDVCRGQNDHAGWVEYMGKGAYDDGREVQIALAALKTRLPKGITA